MRRLLPGFLIWLAVSSHTTELLAEENIVPARGPIKISIANKYYALLDFGLLGGGERSKGKDRADGTLDRQADGTYRGTVTASASATQKLAGLGLECKEAESEGTQQLHVIGYPVDGFSEAQTVTYLTSSTGRADGGFLALEFIPDTDPVMTKEDPCQKKILAQNNKDFLPLNDARWTSPGARYVIALPTSGILNYTDRTVSIIEDPYGDLPDGIPVRAFSNWEIRIQRVTANPSGAAP